MNKEELLIELKNLIEDTNKLLITHEDLSEEFKNWNLLSLWCGYFLEKYKSFPDLSMKSELEQNFVIPANYMSNKEEDKEEDKVEQIKKEIHLVRMFKRILLR